MDPLIFRATMEGQVQVLRQNKHHLSFQTTPPTTPSSMSPPSSAGETALHIAAREGHTQIVKVLIEHAKPDCQEFEKDIGSAIGDKEELMRMNKNTEDTPMHLAASNRHVEVMKMLAGEDPGYSYSGNRAGESPSESNSILKRDKMAAYLTNKDGKTALHIAAGRGHTAAMKELVSHCPDCSDQTDARGRNILHIAVESNEKEAGKCILQDPPFGSLVNAKDEDGNTPLHLLTAKGRHITCLIVDPRVDKETHNLEGLAALDIASCPRRFVAVKKTKRAVPHQLVYSCHFHESESDKARARRHRCPSGPPQPDQQTRGRERRHCSRAPRQSPRNPPDRCHPHRHRHLRAGFTRPGGCSTCGDQNLNGSVTKRAAFKAFFLTDTLAMELFTCAVYIYFVAALHANQTKLLNPNFWAFCLTILAMGAMVLAFVTGTYAALPGASGFAVAACVMGCCFLVYFYVLKKLYFDKLSRRSRLCGHFHGHGMMSHSISDL
ncbi:hypothetical protein NMG60_11025792 [Bertholletia excelsa]